MEMAAPMSIPRFLLPQTGLIWRRANLRGPSSSEMFIARFASKSTKATTNKPIVLEKPEKFVPPSHGSRLPKKATPRHYGGPLSEEEVKTQKMKDYPGLMAPEGTWAHWIWTSNGFHVFITLGTLTGLAVFTFIHNFKSTSPFAEMLPEGSDYLSHPILATRTLFEVIKLTEQHKSAVVAEKRKRNSDDVVKRAEYRKAHGLENSGAFGNWTAKTDQELLGPAIPSDGSVVVDGDKRQKWFGIF